MPIEKQENGKTIIYKIRFIDSLSLMAISKSSLTDNFAEILHKGKCKNCKLIVEDMTARDCLITFKLCGLQQNS